MTPTQYLEAVKAQIEFEKTTVQIQGIGRVKGTPASELKVGDKLMWNYGHTSTITSIELRGKSVYVIETDNKSGKAYDRRFLQNRLVAKV